MSKIFKDNTEEFINKELELISFQKEFVSKEKKKVGQKIFQIRNTKGESSSNEELDFLETYLDMLSEQYNLLCKRDITIFNFIANKNFYVSNDYIKKIIKPGCRLVFSRYYNSEHIKERDRVRTVKQVNDGYVITEDGQIGFSFIRNDYLILPPAENCVECC